jgi:divalent metal cation (Fe/Co/Zn/Cd) transporter
MMTGRKLLDPVVAFLESANILWSGSQRMWQSFNELLD